MGHMEYGESVVTADESDAPPATPSAIDLDRVVVRLARDDDYQRIADHLVLCFGQWPSFEIACPVVDHVIWKMNSNPRARSEQIMGVLDDDDRFIVSLAIRVRRAVWVRGRELAAIDPSDSAVHPDWRRMRVDSKRRGLREALGHHLWDMSLSWLPQHPATRKESLTRPTLGNRVLVFWKPANVRNLVSVPYRTAGPKHAARVALTALRASLGRLPSRLGGRAAASFRAEMVDLERFDDRTDALWEAAKAQFDFAVIRTQDYLNWRYADPRSGRFELRAALEDGELIGYSVTKPYANPAEIVDLLVRPGRLDAVAALVGDAVARVEREGSRDIHCWLPQHHPYVGTVRSLGFLDSGRDPSVRYRAGQIDPEELAFLQEPLAAVHMTQGDSDFV